MKFRIQDFFSNRSKFSLSINSRKVIKYLKFIFYLLSTTCGYFFTLLGMVGASHLIFEAEVIEGMNYSAFCLIGTFSGGLGLYIESTHRIQSATKKVKCSSFILRSIVITLILVFLASTSFALIDVSYILSGILATLFFIMCLSISLSGGIFRIVSILNNS